MQLQLATWAEVESYLKGSTGIVMPIGSTEQHGPNGLIGTDAITAGLTSIRLVLTQPIVMLMWAAIITVLVVLAMLPGFAGLLVVGPILGHASWHAYRAAVAPRKLSTD